MARFPYFFSDTPFGPPWVSEFPQTYRDKQISTPEPQSVVLWFSVHLLIPAVVFSPSHSRVPTNSGDAFFDKVTSTSVGTASLHCFKKWVRPKYAGVNDVRRSKDDTKFFSSSSNYSSSSSSGCVDV